MDWLASGEYTDIRYETAEGIAKITIARPEVRNAFRPLTVRELIRAFEAARDDPAVGVVVLTGEGPLAFCSGGDQSIRGDDGYTDEGGVGRLNVLDLQVQIRRHPKPVVAMVAGYAIGGGHVLHVVCDLTIAADNAVFGQTGPGSARSTAATAWGCSRAPWGRSGRRRSGSCAASTTRRQALQMGTREHRRSARAARGRDRAMVPRAAAHEPAWRCACLKAGFNADTDGLAGVQQLAGDATLLYYMTEEAHEGRDAYVEKRDPDFTRFPRRP